VRTVLKSIGMPDTPIESESTVERHLEPRHWSITLRRWVAAVSGVLLIAGGLTAAGLISATPAAAASLTQVTGFGSNPGNLNMYSYVPTGLASNAPLVVALHGCTQSANDYYSHSGWPKYADLWGFAIVFAEQPSSTNPIINCFDWGTPSNDRRGQGEALSIYQMVQYAQAHYGVDPHRIYVTGLSAGAGMTSDLLADYPDVFAAGSVDSGPPAQCSTSGITNTNCTSGTTSHTPQQWGDLVRNSDPGYSGPWPRVAIWQGSSDTTVNPAAMTESRDQWTNVWGISQTPSSTQSLTGATTRTNYNDASGNPAVVTFSVSGMAHRPMWNHRHLLPQFHLLQLSDGAVLRPERHGPRRADRHDRHRDHRYHGLAELELSNRRGQLQRLPQRHQGQHLGRHRHQLHRHGTQRRHQLQLYRCLR
jgi:poly(hydroxyalkanoate) depolymerase family esterase